LITRDVFVDPVPLSCEAGQKHQAASALPAPYTRDKFSLDFLFLTENVATHGKLTDLSETSHTATAYGIVPSALEYETLICIMTVFTQRFLPMPASIFAVPWTKRAAYSEINLEKL
jgi:hypothetical protein